MAQQQRPHTNRAQEAYDELQRLLAVNQTKARELARAGIGIPDLIMLTNRIEALIDFTMGDVTPAAKDKQRVAFETAWMSRINNLLNELEQAAMAQVAAGQAPERRNASGIILPAGTRGL